MGKLAFPDGEVQFTAAVAMTPGYLYEVGGQVVFIDGLQEYAIGDLANGKTKGTYRFDCVNTDVFANGQIVYFEPDDGKCYPVDDASRFPCGSCRRAKANGGGTEVLVEINAHHRIVIPEGAIQSLSGAGAINVTSYLTKWTTTAANAGTLADGTQAGQLKKIQLIVDGGDGTLTPTNFADGTTITFADAGDFAVLQWDGANWNVVELGNDADGATAPVVA